MLNLNTLKLNFNGPLTQANTLKIGYFRTINVFWGKVVKITAFSAVSQFHKSGTYLGYQALLFFVFKCHFVFECHFVFKCHLFGI